MRTYSRESNYTGVAFRGLKASELNLHILPKIFALGITDKLAVGNTF